MKPRSPWILAVIALLTWSGCGPVTSVHPLSDPASAKADARLEGTWLLEEEEEESKMRIRSLDVGQMELVLETDQEPATFHFFITELASKRYMNLKETSSTFELAGNYLFVSYEFEREGAFLRLYPFQQKALEAAVREGRLQGEIKTSGSDTDIVLKETTEKLAQFVQAMPPDQLLGEVMRFRKIS